MIDDHALSDTVWDRCEQISYEIARRSAPDVFAVPIAKRRAVSIREQAASGGTYTGQDLKWHFKSRHAPQGFAAKPADVVVDAGGTRWTVLEVQSNVYRTLWSLTTRNLALSFGLADRIDVERAALSYDASGAAVKTFPPHGGRVLYAGVLARVQPETEDILDTRGIRGSAQSVRIIVAKQLLGLDVAEDRVRWTDTATGQTTYFDLVRYVSAKLITDLPVLEARQVP